MDEPQELSLRIAWESWQNQSLDEAVRISASWHPRYHFFESRLHTERGFLHAASGHMEAAMQDFRRAVALDHINKPAIAALAALETGGMPACAPYAKESWELETWGSAAAASGLPSIHRLAQRAAGDAALLGEVIALTDATHRHYHRLAALPWLARARYFAAQGQMELARNDCRRGLDLDKNNTELQGLLR